MALGRVSALIFCAAGLVAAPALAQQAPAQDAPPSTPAPRSVITVTGEKDPGLQKVCQNEIVTGSLSHRRVCHTKDEIEEMHRNAAVTMAEMQRVQDTQEHMRMARAAAGGN